MPISIDGSRAEPHDIKQFEGHALYYVLDQRVQDGNLLPIFTTLKSAESYLSQANAPLRIGTPRLEPRPRAAGDVIGDVSLYDKAGFNGNWVTFSDGTDVPDFRHVWCFLWWCQDWNDRPVSVQADVGSKWTVLHEDIYYQGSWIMILSGSWIPDLSPYGWAYRASSLSFSWAP